MPLSPLDGRYREKVADLEACFSDVSVTRERLRVLLEWLFFLGEMPEVTEVPQATDEQVAQLRKWASGFDEEDLAEVERIERETRHDLVALLTFLSGELAARSLKELSTRVHYCCTSEDVVSAAYALTARSGVAIWSEAVTLLRAVIADKAVDSASVPMLARTHGQPAVGTTFGKELAVFAARLDRQIRQIDRLEFLAKFGGAVGNFNAHVLLHPEVDWPSRTERFLLGLGVMSNSLTTQVEAKDWLAELCHLVVRVNTIVLDLVRDMWTYTSFGYLNRPAVGVGSSAMPQKVNPVRFENAEGNLGLSTAMLGHMAEKLPTSRLQRDLSDSTVMRNFGLALAHSALAMREATAGLEEAVVDSETTRRELDAHWETMTEAVQAVFRKAGLEHAERLARSAAEAGEGALPQLLRELGIQEQDAAMLLALKPSDYVGIAPQLAKMIDRVDSSSLEEKA